MDRLTTIFREVLDLPDLDVSGLTRSNCADWDSLAHVRLIIAIEEEFEVKFNIDQVAGVQSAEEIRQLLATGNRK